MQYRTFGKLDWQASALGFGCMRFPVLDGDQAKIDEPQAIAMLRHAIDEGVNYIDTAYPYHEKNSEPVVGKALQDGYRQKVRLATKLPVWAVDEYADFDKYLNRQLSKLQTEHIDFYLLHALHKEMWEKVYQMDVLNWAEKAVADGRIGCLGFSFHDSYEVFQQIIDAYDGWTFCQIQYNYIDIEEQAGMKGLHYAAAKGLAVVIMEPLLGGRLANPPQDIQQIFDEQTPQKTAADWALQWLWQQPEVSVVLSGMGNMQQVKENIASASRSAVGSFTAAENEVITRVRSKFKALHPIPCTQCLYCMPCPNGVDIPNNLDLINKGTLLDDFQSMIFSYNRLPETARADHCIQCRECDEKCPQSIPISEWMPIIHDVIANGKPYNGPPGRLV